MDPDLTIVLLGNTGVGKSASGNTILGRQVFEARQSLTPVTKEISQQTALVCGMRITVVDTPGLLKSEEVIRTFCQELLQSSRVCLFLVVFRVGQFTREQEKALLTVSRVLGPQVFRKCYLLFTGGDTLGDSYLEDFFQADEESSALVRAFSRRCHLFNNEYEEQDQVRELLIKTGHLVIVRLPQSDRRIVLLGLPGGGRSSSGNNILGSNEFQAAGGFNPVSIENVTKTTSVEGRLITVVDTAGFDRAHLSPLQLYTDITRSIEEASPGPHALVFVVKIGSISAEQITLIEELPKVVDSEVRRYTMVLFTHGDLLGQRSIENLIQSNQHVSKLVSLCQGRYKVFDNRARRNRDQARHFLSMIDAIVAANHGQHLTCDMFRVPGTLNKLWCLLSRTWGFIKPYRKYAVIVSLIVVSVMWFTHEDKKIEN